MRESTLFETIADRLLVRQGIGLIWQLHLRASASHLDGNWLAAAVLIGLQMRRRGSGRIVPGSLKEVRAADRASARRCSQPLRWVECCLGWLYGEELR